MCIEDSQDFEDDQGCNLSPDLLRMVEQDDKKNPTSQRISRNCELRRGTRG